MASRSSGWSWYLNPRPFRPNGRMDHKPTSRSKPSISGFLVNKLAESSVCGVNRVASSNNCCQRTAWMLVLMLCMGGFGFQTFKFLKIYYRKPSVIQLEVVNEGKMEFPAVTICTRNRFRRSEFCADMPEKCRLISLYKNRRMTNSLIGDVIYKLLSEKNYEKMHRLGHSNYIIQDCHFHGYPEVKLEECLQMLEHIYDPEYGNCYVIPPQNVRGQTLKAREADYWHLKNDLILVLDVEADEFVETQKPVGLTLVVHDDNFTADLQTHGIFLAPGNFYTIEVKKSTVYHLPYPYHPNCLNFITMPWQKPFKKRLTPRGCTIGCSQFYQLKKCNFVTKRMSLFYKELPYDPDNLTDAAQTCAENEEMESRDTCRSMCGLPCREPQMSPIVSRETLTRNKLYQHTTRSSINRTWEKEMQNLVLVKVHFATLEHTIYRHVAKYDTMELFSYLGSYSGVWLGFSLLTVYEMAEIILSTILFAIRKYIMKRNHKKRLETISDPSFSKKEKGRKKRFF